MMGSLARPWTDRPARVRRIPLRVEELEGRRLPSTFTVINTADTGFGSFRDAILDANSAPGADTIAFDIPGNGPFTISPTSSLPQITDSVTIDGDSQPGSSPNTLADGDNAVLKVQVNASIVITAAGCTVRGLAIGGITLSGDDNRVEGNFIGTDVTGTQSVSLTFDIQVIGGARGNVIGGTVPAARNVISGNANIGVYLYSSNATSVQGNFIGTDVNGTRTLGTFSYAAIRIESFEPATGSAVRSPARAT